MERIRQLLVRDGVLWQALFFALLALVLLAVFAQGPVDTPFLYRAPGG